MADGVHSVSQNKLVECSAILGCLVFLVKGRIKLIKLTAINNKQLILNAEHIEKLEAVPESLITLTNGNKYIVLESTDEIINKIIEYKNKIFRLGL